MDTGELLFGALAVGGIGLAMTLGNGEASGQFGDIQKNALNDRIEQVRSEQNANSDRRRVEQSRKAANNLFESVGGFDGCLQVADLGGNSHVNFREGDTIVDRVTKAPLPPGTVICSNNGAIARIQDGGIIGQVFISPDIKAAFEATLPESGEGLQW